MQLIDIRKHKAVVAALRSPRHITQEATQGVLHGKGFRLEIPTQIIVGQKTVSLKEEGSGADKAV